MRISVQTAAFDLGAESAAFAATVPGAGAVVTFTGIVRGDGGLHAMEIEHYPGMTEAALADYTQAAIARFRLTDALVIHRHGRLAVGEPIMMVATAAPHRADAFAAADYLMDWLKSRAPFWKKEIGPDGAAWVAANNDDEMSLARWTPPG